MRVKALRDFMSNEFGDFSAGYVYDISPGIARFWINAGIVEAVEQKPVLLQSKPELPVLETKPEIRKRRIKKNEDHHAANL